MTTTIIASLEKLLGGPRDGALLRFSLGNEWLKAGHPAKAAECFRAAVERDPSYSAAWKLLGKALVDSGDRAAALEAFKQGIHVAEQKGDLQAAKEMSVFARRLQKQTETPNDELPSGVALPHQFPEPSS
jgi:predicted Zn-dependent protease